MDLLKFLSEAGSNYACKRKPDYEKELGLCYSLISQTALHLTWQSLENPAFLGYSGSIAGAKPFSAWQLRVLAPSIHPGTASRIAWPGEPAVDAAAPWQPWPRSCFPLPSSPLQILAEIVPQSRHCSHGI